VDYGGISPNRESSKVSSTTGPAALRQCWQTSSCAHRVSYKPDHFGRAARSIHGQGDARIAAQGFRIRTGFVRFLHDALRTVTIDSREDLVLFMESPALVIGPCLRILFA
jgi:hypothetical protein